MRELGCDGSIYAEDVKFSGCSSPQRERRSVSNERCKLYLSVMTQNFARPCYGEAGKLWIADRSMIDERCVSPVWYQLWDAGDIGQYHIATPTAYERNLIDDALLVFSETGVLDKNACVQTVNGRPGDASGASWRIKDARLVTLAPDAAVLSYRAEATRPGGESASILVASAYSRQDGAWKLAFHQQTVI